MPEVQTLEPTDLRTFGRTPTLWSIGRGGSTDPGAASDASVVVLRLQEAGSDLSNSVVFNPAGALTAVWWTAPREYRRVSPANRSISSSRAEFDADDAIWSAIGEDPVARPIAKLHDLRHLEEDWDSYGGSSPTEESLRTAAALIRTAEAMYGGAVGARAIPHDIAPIPRGGVQMEWRGTNAEVEVEIGPDGVPSYLLKHPQPDGSRRYTERHRVDWSELVERLNDVLLN